MPYSTLEEYFSDSIATRIAKLSGIPNLGMKTANEFNEIAERYIASNTEAASEFFSGSASLIEQERPNIAKRRAAEDDGKIVDRYSNLSSREVEVIRRRFGIGREATQTLEEVGLVFDVTRERIRQIESSALRKMRSARIKRSWEKYVADNIDNLLNAVFGTEPIIEKPATLSGEPGLAVEILYESVSEFLEHKAKRFEHYWVKPSFRILEIQSARNRLASYLREASNLPISVNEVIETIKVSGGVIAAAVSAMDGYKLYEGWVIRGNATSRKRRVVNILNLFHKYHIGSPSSLWQMKVAYWEKYEDKCSGRDLVLCLQEHKSHFLNLRELGWICLSRTPDQNPEIRGGRDAPERAAEGLYTKPVRTGRGLANCVYEMFERHGPLRLADAANVFEREYPKYKVTSMYPMLVYFAVFLRFAPGIVGIQSHYLDRNALKSARHLVLNNRDLDLFLLSRVAGPPKVRYPLWNAEMEREWAGWLVGQQDWERLGALLRVSKIREWNISESERQHWLDRCMELDGVVRNPEMRIFSERRIDTNILTTALAAATVFGFVNWMYLNQALGWRIETTRVGLVLAILIRIGVFRPTAGWSKPHVLTRRGRQISQSILGRSITTAPESRKTMRDFLVDSSDAKSNYGWAGRFEFEQLLAQITDISGEEDENSDSSDEAERRIESAYEGFMGDELRRLIEGD